MRRVRFLIGIASLGIACGSDDVDLSSSASSSSSSSSSTAGGQSSTTSTSGAADASAPKVAAPTITTNPPPVGSGVHYWTKPIEVTIASPGASIFYTTDGTTPTVASTRYTGPFLTSSDGTIKAIASIPGFTDSDVSDLRVFIYLVPPGVSPDPGEYTNAFNVTMSTPDAVDTTICYRMDGAIDPTCTEGVCDNGSTRYEPTAPPLVSVTDTTVRAISCKAGTTTRAANVLSYVLRVAPIVASPAPPGNVSGATNVTLSTATQNAVIHYTTDGTPVDCATGTAAASPASLTVTATTTINAIACRTGFRDFRAESFTYGLLPAAPFFVTGPDAAQLASDPSQVETPSGAVFAQDVRLIIPNEQNAAGVAIDTRPGTRRPNDIDCFTTDGTTPACVTGVSTCSHGTRYAVPTTTSTATVTSTGGQPVVSRDGQQIKVVRCRENAGVSLVATYTYGLKVGDIAVSYVTRDSSSSVVPAASKENDELGVAISSASGVRTELTSGAAGNPTDNGLDSIRTGIGSTQPGAVPSKSPIGLPDEEKHCYTLDGSTAPTCSQIQETRPGSFPIVGCGPGSTDHSAKPIGSGTFATGGSPQRLLPFTLRVVACKVGFQNSNERQIVFGGP